MFVSFFPKPKLFFASAVLWSLLLVLFWFNGGAALGSAVGLHARPAAIIAEAAPVPA